MDSNHSKQAIAVVSDFKFLKNNFNNIYSQLRNIGKYQGEILVITTKLCPTFVIKSIRKKK